MNNQNSDTLSSQASCRSPAAATHTAPPKLQSIPALRRSMTSDSTENETRPRVPGAVMYMKR